MKTPGLLHVELDVFRHRGRRHFAQQLPVTTENICVFLQMSNTPELKGANCGRESGLRAFLREGRTGLRFELVILNAEIKDKVLDYALGEVQEPLQAGFGIIWLSYLPLV